MRRVWICQCLCPGRHAILALAGEANDGREANAAIRTPLRTQVTAILAAGKLNPWCSLCGASPSTWRFELRETVFTSMDEASPVLRRFEADQAMTRALLGDRGPDAAPSPT
jgi:hypothetical protein